VLAAIVGCSPTQAAGRPHIQLGVNLMGLPGDGARLDDYTARVGARPDIVMWYQGWDEPLFWPGQMRTLATRKITPMVTWTPQKGAEGIPLRDIAAGVFDAYIAESAHAAASLKRPFMIRFAHEMNLAGSAYGSGANGNTPADFIAAWQHIVTIFRAAGATNVQWVWSPNVDYLGQAPFAAYYPGDAWVDWVGLDGYNWGTLRKSGWRTAAQVFVGSYRKLAALTHKPVMIAETASPECGGDKASWILRTFLKTVPQRMPRVRAVIWFDRVKEADWRVDSSAESLAAYRTVAASRLYGGTGRAHLRPNATGAAVVPVSPHRRACGGAGI
jgi:hypothetical protein